MTNVKPTLFPRRTRGKRPLAEQIARARAHVILDRAQAGHDIPGEDIAWALRTTGDLAGDRQPQDSRPRAHFGGEA